MRTERLSLLAGLLGAVCLLLVSNRLAWGMTMLVPTWAERISIALMVLLPVLGAALSVPAVQRRASRLLGRSVAPRARCFALGCGAAMFALVAWHAGVMCWRDMAVPAHEDASRLSMWMVSLWIPMLAAALAVRQLIALFRVR